MRYLNTRIVPSKHNDQTITQDVHLKTLHTYCKNSIQFIEILNTGVETIHRGNLTKIIPHVHSQTQHSVMVA